MDSKFLSLQQKKFKKKFTFVLGVLRVPDEGKSTVYSCTQSLEKKLQVSVEKNYFIASLQAREIKLYLSVNSRCASVCLSLISSLAPQLALR